MSTPPDRKVFAHKRQFSLRSRGNIPDKVNPLPLPAEVRQPIRPGCVATGNYLICPEKHENWLTFGGHPI
jgi:hypothetical protein